MFRVSEVIKIKSSIDEIWAVISTPGHLNLFHPFCKEHNTLKFKDNTIIKDELIYLNGLNYVRNFNKWVPRVGYSLKIGSINAKQSSVNWEIIKGKSDINYVKITIKPYLSDRIPKFLYPFYHYIIIRPKLKSYLKSVLMGLNYYMLNKKSVPKSFFGTHSWFS